MKKQGQIWLLLILVLFLSSCAYSRQSVRLDPDIHFSPSFVGAGQVIALQILDERNNTDIGQKGSAYGPAAKIESVTDVKEMVREKLSQGFENMGFRVVPYDMENEQRLIVEIRDINYSTSIGFWTGGVHTKSSFKIRAFKNIEEYSQFYRSEKEKRIVFVPSDKHNSQLINDIVAEGLGKILNDDQLVDFLL